MVVRVAWVAGASSGLCLCLWAWRRRVLQMVEEERRLRLEERRGRTRAEIALRNFKKSERSGFLPVAKIGVLRTPFVKRAGTPRQGGVCPTSRGVVELEAPVTASSLEGLEGFSFVWVVFEFHASTESRRVASKVSPPRGYGKKVGWVATRSPHRANPLGLSLVRLDRVDSRRLRLEVSGVDACDGTPVLDVKPWVPWDAPFETPRVPEWVSRQDSLRETSWSPEAASQLEELAALATHYEGDVEGARRAIGELLVQDPRNNRARNSRATAAYRIEFGGTD
ncbi:hypothetical protein CTAYLR_004635 [Chrysophaeum taylorii]|uniref:TsaA-like domain-containing protein n=1 Tax=Chrysophaeum taylorii TaxID=2483200 RepID=A0AAD7UPJ1_9STRA|nr:hypothetical protein CTAYLR_004635 [Chrysophaeum taylorii]